MSISPPTSVELPLGDLIVDPVVQRSLDQARVNELLRTWGEEYIGVWHISQRADGTLHTVDGQHRSATMKILGYAADFRVPCRVYTGLTLSEEARLFRQLNKSRQVNMIDLFRVRVVGEDTPAVELDAMLRQQGWKVVSGSGNNTGVLRSVAALEKIYTRFGLGTAEAVIRVITASWGRQSAGVNGAIVSGLGHLLGRYGGQVDEAKLVRELMGLQPQVFVAQARQLVPVIRGTIVDAVATSAVRLHNRGRRTRLLPDWESTATFEQRVRRARDRAAARAIEAVVAEEI